MDSTYQIYNVANATLHKKNATLPYQGNPLRFYTIYRAIQDIENYDLGVFAPAVLAFDTITKHDSIIPVLIEKREGAIRSLDYQIKTSEETFEAEVQQEVVQEYLNSFDNLPGVFAEMEMASFYGYSFHEKLMEKGLVVGFNHIPLEFISKKGIDYYYNASGAFGAGVGTLIDPQTVMMRCSKHPIMLPLNVLYLRKTEGQTSHDEFIENYSIPSTFIVAPENTPPSEHQAFVDAAKNVINNSRGVLPFGSQVTQVKTTEDNNAVFITYKDSIDKEIVLRCTGGLLTTLSMPQGIGSGSTDAHQDSFNQIIAGDSCDISEIFDREVIKPFVDKMFPNQKKLVYFKMDISDEAKVLENILKLKQVGFDIDPTFVEEKFGIKLAIPTTTTTSNPL